eukprot:gene11988-13086_t
MILFYFPKFCKNFKTWWMLHYIGLSTIIGLLISNGSNYPILDGIFLGASAMTGAGLSTYPMADLHTAGFVWTAVLMIFGSATFMLLPTTLYRRSCFEKINTQMIQQFQSRKKHVPFTKKNLRIIEESYLIYESLGMLTNIILLYFALWMFFGILGVYGTLHIFPLQAELAERGASYLDSAVYLTVSAFANSGLAMTSDSLIGLENNPACYMILSVLILAGNCAIPIFLRYFIRFLRYCNRQLVKYYPDRKNRFSFYQPYNYYFNREAILTFILNHPRKLTTHLFHEYETKLLILMVFLLIAIQYIFFIFSVLFDYSLLDKYSLPQLLGIGYFQTISTRAAGFTIMDLRLLNQGLLLIYCIMMYVSAFPFVTTLYSTNTNLEDEPLCYEEDEADFNENEQTKLIQRNTIMNDDLENPRIIDLEEGLIVDLLRKKGTGEEKKITTMLHDLSNTVKDNVDNLIHQIQIAPPIENRRVRWLDDVVGGVTVNTLHSTGGEMVRSISSLSMDMEDEESEEEADVTEKRIQIINKEEDNNMKLSSIKETEPLIFNSQTSIKNDLSVHEKFAKRFFLRHTFFLVLTLVILAYSEDSLMKNPEYDVNLFYILFEMISAYGSIGLTLGIPGKAYSLSGQMSSLGKCCIIFLMWLGKHRGLPNQDDEVIDFTFEKFQLAYMNGNDSSISSHENEKSEESHFLQAKLKIVNQTNSTRVSPKRNPDHGRF